MSTTPSAPSVSAPPPPDFMSQVKDVMRKGVEVGASFNPFNAAFSKPLDATRRYISNMPDLFGYGTHHFDRARSLMPDHAFKMIVKDQPVTGVYHAGTPAASMRRELLRRGFGIHTAGKSDWFAPVSTAEGKTVQLNPQLHAGSQTLNTEAGLSAFHQLTGPHAKSDTSGNELQKILLGIVRNGRKTPEGWRRARTASNVLSNYPLTYKGNGIYNVRDVWDFALHPTEQKVFNGKLKGLLTAPVQVAQDPVFQTMLGRKLLQGLMHDGPAAFDQDFQITRNGVVPLVKKSSPSLLLQKLLTRSLNIARPIAHYTSRVPQGERFRDAPFRNTITALAKPYLGRYTPWVNATAAGALGLGFFDRLSGAATSVPEHASNLEGMLLRSPTNTGLRSWLSDIADSPGRSALATMWNGIPYGVTTDQKAWAKDALSLQARKAVHAPPPPTSTWRKAVHAVQGVLSPLRVPLGAAVNTGFKAVVPPPRPEEVKDLAVRRAQAIPPFQK